MGQPVGFGCTKGAGAAQNGCGATCQAGQPGALTVHTIKAGSALLAACHQDGAWCCLVLLVPQLTRVAVLIFYLNCVKNQTPTPCGKGNLCLVSPFLCSWGGGRPNVLVIPAGGGVWGLPVRSGGSPCARGRVHVSGCRHRSLYASSTVWQTCCSSASACRTRSITSASSCSRSWISSLWRL